MARKNEDGSVTPLDYRDVLDHVKHALSMRLHEEEDHDALRAIAGDIEATCDAEVVSWRQHCAFVVEVMRSHLRTIAIRDGELEEMSQQLKRVTFEVIEMRKAWKGGMKFEDYNAKYEVINYGLCPETGDTQETCSCDDCRELREHDRLKREA